ncbi:MAG: glycosyltransferase family 4 protein [Bryobacterales bacterium]|nr:glycosyltransferase family 4 protein [Bryobacterales bacterium]
MSRDVRVAFASGSRARNPSFLRAFSKMAPELPLYVVSEFSWPEGKWIPYHPYRSFWENYLRCRQMLRGKRVRWAAVLLEPRMPYRKMSLLGLLLGRSRLLVFNENLDHYRLHPRCFGTMVRHVWWRTREFLDREFHPGGSTYTFLWRLRHPHAFRRPLAYTVGLAAGCLARWLARMLPAGVGVSAPVRRAEGLSVLVYGADAPSGAELGARLCQHWGVADCEVTLVTGADDGELIRQINRVAGRTAFRWLCVLPANATVAPRSLQELLEAFERIPGLFCVTPRGLRFLPEVLWSETPGADSPLAAGQGSYVLGSDCGLWSVEKLLALGGLSERWETVQFALLEAGLRAWRRGWPSLELADTGFCVPHRVKLNPEMRRDALRFLVTGLGACRKLWRRVLAELNRLAAREEAPPHAVALLGAAARAPLWVRARSGKAFSDQEIVGLTSGAVRVFAGRGPRGRPTILIASPYLPFPLAHGGAVRMYNLMRRAATEYDLVLISFTSELAPPAPELLETCAEVVLVHRVGRHSRPATSRPDVVEEFDSPAFHAALRLAAHKWKPFAVQLEYTQMAQYAGDGAPARTILVEHDITFDLYEQLYRLRHGFDLRREAAKWRRFERQAWQNLDCVVVMSQRDRAFVTGAPVWIVPNGVDLERFRPSETPPEPRRLLFVGSFAHLPNLLALEFFLNHVWPRLATWSPRLHIIAGQDYQRYLSQYRDRVELDLSQPGIELEGFVADVRPAYRRATVVLAPLVASAGTNIKVLEALAMGKAVVSTPAGIHGLELEPGREVLVASDAEGLAAAIVSLWESEEARRALERSARAAAESRYDWDRIAERQRALYQALRGDREPFTARSASRKQREAVHPASRLQHRLGAHRSRG